jgi:hypothetical protein
MNILKKSYITKWGLSSSMEAGIILRGLIMGERND